MHIASKSSTALIAFVTSLICGQRTLACEDIAVVSDDARYLVLSGDTLEEKDVGNLWWLGIRGIDYVAAGSTLLRAAVFPDRLVDVMTGALVPDRSNLIVLHDVGRSLRSPDEMRTLGETTLTKVWWINDTPSSKLIGLRRTGKEQTLALFGSDLSLQSVWPLDPPSLGLGVACEDRKRIVVGGLTEKLVTENGSSVIKEPLRKPSGVGDYRLLGVTPVGCTGLMAENIADASEIDLNADQLEVRTIDLATNQLGPKFQLKRAAVSTLIAGGTKVLQQDLLATAVDGGGYRMTPTGSMRVVDSQSGSILKRSKLPAGATSRLVCRGDSEKVLISAPRKIYLVDVESLSVVASRQVPFERYFAF